jgi:hypothetical protein
VSGALNIGDLDIRAVDAGYVANDRWVTWCPGNYFESKRIDEKAAGPIKIGYGEACVVGAQYLKSAHRSHPSVLHSDKVRTLT